MSSENKKGGKRKPKYLGPAARAERILRDLKNLTLMMAERHGHDPYDPFPIDLLDFSMVIPTGGYKKIRAETGKLLDRLNDQVEIAMKGRSLFRPGRVYCFQCDVPDCEHSLPPTAVDTFTGYTATGKPTWKSFLNVCLEAGDERVDKLYDDKPEPIARLMLANDLNADLLPSFGGEARFLSLLGQSIVGWVSSEPGKRVKADTRTALTVQVLETQSGEPKKRLRMNVLGLSWDTIVDSAVSGPPNAAPENLRKLLSQTRDELMKIERRKDSDPELSTSQMVDSLLGRLTKDLHSVLATPNHRTQHASERHQDNDRPIRTAVRDADESSNDRIMWDTRHKTIVVLGPKGRTHMFTEDARHVTSIRLGNGELERKSQSKRWISLDPRIKQGFRQRLRNMRDRS
jgi:hypothetical protein